jgi:hypothetical protein
MAIGQEYAMSSHANVAVQEVRDANGDVLQEFEGRLAVRTKVPAERLSDFLGWSEDKVRAEAKLVTRILKRFAEAVVHSMEDPDSMGSFIAELDLKTISRDHDWRAIFASLRGQPGDIRQQQRAVLIKYLQYLSFRKRLLDFIHARKAGLEETDELSAELTRVPGSDERSERSVVRLGVVRSFPDDDFERMPLGETVEVPLGAEDVLEFSLARHRFELVGGRDPYVVDRKGVTCFVRPGRNMVGRHPESDITVDPNFSDVSRAHLVLEWDGGDTFRLMDLSSRGTWLRREVLATASAVCDPQSLLAASRPM